jgi:hypothetical protein
MKRIIDGKAYNTETAARLAEVNLTGQKEGPFFDPKAADDCGRTTLYQTAGGAYFIVRDVKEGVFRTLPDFKGDPRSSINQPGLYPLTRKEALAWAEYHQLDADKIEAIFGRIPEAGQKTGSILLRLPEALKKRMEDAARDSDQSVNAWAMRCMETCAELDDIKEHVARIAWIARTHVARPDQRAFSRVAMGRMLDEIDAEVGELGPLLGVTDWCGEYAGTPDMLDLLKRYQPYTEDGDEFTD